MSNVDRFAKVTEVVNGIPIQYNVMRDIYVYTFPVITSLAPSATAVQSINVEANSNFIWEVTTCFVDDAGAAQTVNSQVLPLVTVQIADTGSGTRLFSSALPIPSLCGPNMAGMANPFGRCFSGNSTIQATFFNYSAGTTYTNLYLQLHGYKEWRVGG